MELSANINQVNLDVRRNIFVRHKEFFLAFLFFVFCLVVLMFFTGMKTKKEIKNISDIKVTTTTKEINF